MKMKDIKKMSYKELDKYIDELPYKWMKALRLDFIRRVRPDYSYHRDKKES